MQNSALSSEEHWQDTKIYHRWCMWKTHPCICHNSSWLCQCKSVRPTRQSTTSCSTYVQYSGENSHPNRKVGSYYTVLRQLHWLPISQRIAYKILLLTFKALHGLAPQYISKLIKLQVTDRSTRQTDTNKLHQPVMRAPTFGDRAFVSAPPSLWNRLPVSVRKIETLTSFKKELKTFLFKTAYK